MMAKIDIQQWGNFKVKDVFETNLIGKTLQVPTGAMVERKNLREGDIPRVTVSNFNNGITGYYADIDDSNYRVYENFISVSFLGTVFYQPSRASLDMKVHCLKLKGRSYNINIAEYLVTVVRNAIKNFMYADQLSSTVLPDLEIQLPVCQNGEPDWEYMDTYMSEVLRESEANLENMRQASTLKKQIDTTEWKEFVIGDLFDVVKGTRLTKAKMKEGKNRFIGSSAMNNGVTALVANNEPMHPANTITVCYNGSVGESFYQNEPFLASDDVNVFYPKFLMNQNIALYLIPLIKRISKQYNYIDKWKLEYMLSDVIKLPIALNGEPNWEYMDDFMSNVLEQSEKSLDSLMH